MLQMISLIERNFIKKIQKHNILESFSHLFTNLFSLNIVLPYLLLDFAMAFNFKIIIAATVAIIYCIKHVTKRNRPFMYPDIKKKGYIKNEDDLSFPSSHSAVSMLMCKYWYYVEFKNRGSIILLLLPYFVGLSRPILGVHYFTDVLCGLLIGEIIFRSYFCISF